MRMLRVTPSIIAALVVVACQETVTVPTNSGPFLYLVLVRDTASSTKGASALLLTVGTPNASPYRAAQQFEMRRHADGALFDWVQVARADTVSPANFNGLSDPAAAANFHLPPTGASGRLGASDLADGEQYDLTILTDGQTVHGSARLPGAIVPRSLTGPDDGKKRVVWNSVTGAAAYAVSTGFTTTITTDTTVELAAPFGSGLSEIVVTALDAGLYDYISDANARRGGIDIGYGVFGGLSRARVTLPP
jgi:hypothetical protein